LGEIVTSVKRVTDIITEMAAASREQSTGIEQVNKAVSQMDTVTQRNAGQTEEMSATAQTLTDQANQLRELVGRFKLTAEAPAPGRPAPQGSPKTAPTTKPRPAVARALKNGRDRSGGDGFTEF
ncbi:MAG TPA: methyl-accepting chemotaxis protein, partial [Gemmata sp.]